MRELRTDGDDHRCRYRGSPRQRAWPHRIDQRAVSARRAGTARAGVCQSEICCDPIQRFHAGRATEPRCAGGSLRTCGSQGRGEGPANPQSATLELYEAAERSCRTTHQFPRDESREWYPPVDSIWCEQMSELIQQKPTGPTCLCFLSDLLFKP